MGLSYAQQRWYEPGTGRFLSEDPVFGDLASPSSMHAFGYANGNPLLYTDPRGTTACMPGDSGSCFQEAQENDALCAGEKDERACRRQLAKYEAYGVAGGVAVSAAVVAAPGVIAAAAGAGAKGTALLTAAGAVLTRYGNQAANAVRALLAWGSQNPQKVVDTASVATACIDSGTAEGCTLALVTHGMVPGGRSPQRIPPPTARPVRGAQPASSLPPEQPAAKQEAPSSPNGARFPNDPERLFPEGYAGLEKTVRPDGKIDYQVQAGPSKYRVEYHPKHQGKPGDHFDGDHYHVKKEAEKPQPPKTKPNWFRLPNKDPDTPATPGGGTFAPGDKLPTENQ